MAQRARTRRALLGAVSGGFALAARGLVLPAWLEEADAREGAHGGTLGGRRGKDRRGRDPHRHDRNHRGGDNRPDRKVPKGSFGPEGNLKIKFVLINANPLGTEPLDATCFYYKWDSPDVTNGAFGWDDKTVPAGGSVEFVTNVKKAALWFDHDRHFVWAKNPFFGHPTAEIVSAGGRGGAGPKNMDVGDTLSWRYGLFQIEVRRQDDYGEHKVFWVHYKSTAGS